MQPSLITLIHEYGLGHYASSIQQVALPSIELVLEKREHENAIPIGESKFGGMPDLPLDVPWPSYDNEPLLFIAQLNLLNMPHDLMQQPFLPPTGMLYFFVSCYVIDDYAVRVLYCDGDREGLKRQSFTSEAHQSFWIQRIFARFFQDDSTRRLPILHPFHISTRELLTLPTLDLLRENEAIQFSPEEAEAYEALQLHLGDREHMFGYADPVQLDDM